MSAPVTPEGYATVNPCIITSDADEIGRFIIEVFDGEEHAEARTIDEDGLLLQSEVRVGTTTIMLAERKPDWPFTPSLLQVYVHDIDVVLDRAIARNARLITEPTDFFGTRLARVQDSSANIWWIWQHGEMDAEERSSEQDWTVEEQSGGWGQISPELAYIHDTLLAAMTGLRDPRA
ncbi:VOC family protein [Microbacterium sp. MAHUQ-60]|uniref:VOC family protein n=1 Tax=unclassified Microbacterium TaxID=2609290 RepID=UPI00361D7928